MSLRTTTESGLKSQQSKELNSLKYVKNRCKSRDLKVTAFFSV
jgi:hypothetical protein